MWSSNQSLFDTKRTSTHLKPLKLLSSNTPAADRLESPANLSPPKNRESWRKEFRLSRVAERERKKLSTATASSASSSTSDSFSTSRAPPTPCDLPVLDGQLMLFEEKLDVVENMMTAKKRMFDNLERDSERLNVDLQKQLAQKTPSKSLPFPNKPILPAPSKDGGIGAGDSSKLPPASDGSTASKGASSPDMASTWGAYIKRLW